MTNKKVFEAHEPTLTDDDIREAEDDARMVVSFRGKPVIEPPTEIGFLAVKFVFAAGTSQTILLDQFGARLLHGLIGTINNLNWDGAAIVPKDESPI